VSWNCFLVKAVEEQEAWLRRYADGPCPLVPGDGSYHGAMTSIGRIELSYTKEGYIDSTDPSLYEEDERWPTTCECGYEFRVNDDPRQVMGRQLWENIAGERRMIDRPWRSKEHPPMWEPGAMFDAFWLGDWAKGPDGLHLSVVLPPDNHIWHVDGPSTSGGRWSRSGTPPDITATPSILTPKYHGFLQGGVLTDSLADRPL
jgi:hypothetical protein